jgi:hypothetical protein
MVTLVVGRWTAVLVPFIECALLVWLQKVTDPRSSPKVSIQDDMQQ